MTDLLNWHNVTSAIIFSAIGLLIYFVGFLLLEVLTPKVAVWRELVEQRNMALAVFLGSVAIGIALIIAAAIHG